MRRVMGFLGTLRPSEDANDQIVKRGQQVIEQFLLKFLEITHQERRSLLLRKTKQGVAVIFRSQVGQHPHTIAIEPGDIDAAHLERSYGLQLAN